MAKAQPSFAGSLHAIVSAKPSRYHHAVEFRDIALVTITGAKADHTSSAEYLPLTFVAVLRWRHPGPALEGASEVACVVEAEQEGDFSHRAGRLLHVRTTEFLTCIIEQLLKIRAVL